VLLIVLLALIGASAWRGLENVGEGFTRWTWVALGLVIRTSDGQILTPGGKAADGKAAWTGNRHLVFIASRYITQEMYEQRLLDRLGVSTMLEIFDPEDRAILERLSRRSS
jgi:hypothetical protein